MCCGQWIDPSLVAVPMDTKKETWLFPIFAYQGCDKEGSGEIFGQNYKDCNIFYE